AAPRRVKVNRFNVVPAYANALRGRGKPVIIDAVNGGRKEPPASSQGETGGSRAGAARRQGGLQGLCGTRARWRRPVALSGRGACADWRERRRQVDAHENPDRLPAAEQRRGA